MHNQLKLLVILFFLVATVGLCALQSKRACAENVRPSSLAGSWYPSDPRQLEKMLNDYRSKSTPPAVSRAPLALPQRTGHALRAAHPRGDRRLLDD